MNRLLVIVNRALFGVVALAGAGFAAAISDSGVETSGEVAPLQMPTFSLPAMSKGTPLVFPARNAFDPEGTPWRPAAKMAEAPGKAASVAAAAARGLVVLPGLEGVLTDAGFVLPGQPLPEGQLKQVTGNGYVVAGAGGDRTIDFDAERSRVIDELLHPVARPAADAGAATVPGAPQAPMAAPGVASQLIQQLQQRQPPPPPPAARPPAPPPRPLPPGSRPLGARAPMLGVQRQ